MPVAAFSAAPTAADPVRHWQASALAMGRSRRESARTCRRVPGLSTQIITFFVGLSVAFGIASVLSISVDQRTREIGILRAMGTTPRRARRIVGEWAPGGPGPLLE